MGRRPVSSQASDVFPGLVPAIYSIESEIRGAHEILDDLGVPLLVGERADLVVRLRALKAWIEERHGSYNLDEPLRGSRS